MMPEAKKGPLAICCLAESAFVRAHAFAISQARTSILVPPGEWRQLPALAAMFESLSVLTDAPASSALLPFSPQPVVALQSASLPPPAAWPDPLAILLTSGTSGAPVPIFKSVTGIIGEIQALRTVLNIHAESCFLATVPLAHMFGYVFGLWLPHFAQARLHPERIVLPEALRTLCANSTAPLWIVTTPVHLRAYVALKMQFQNVAGVICATSRLSSSLARQAAACFGIPITEIYGSTETGAIAYRLRCADESRAVAWSPLPGIAIQQGSDGCAQCEGAHLDGVITLSDRIECNAAGFQILGRVGDLVKVCGKRHSREALNSLLCAVPGVLDASYFFPDDALESREMARPSAFVVLASGVTSAHVLGHLRGRIDDVFLPRPLFEVASLPRSGTGKLADADLKNLYRRCRRHMETT